MAIDPRLPTGALLAGANFWGVFDNRVKNIAQKIVESMGKPRSRPLSIVIPLAGATTPAVGWLSTVGIINDIVIVGWEIHSLTSGSIVVDLRVSSVQPHVGDNPNPISISGPSNPITLTSGFTTSSMDVSQWTTTQVNAGGFISAYATSVASLSQTILLLRAIDMNSNVLQR